MSGFVPLSGLQTIVGSPRVAARLAELEAGWRRSGAVAEEGAADDERADDEGDGEALVGFGDPVDGDDGAEDVGEDQDRGHVAEGTA